MHRIITALLLGCLLFIPGCKKDPPPTVQTAVAAHESLIKELIDDHVEDDARRDKLLLLLGKSRIVFAGLVGKFFELNDKLRNNPQFTREQAMGYVGEYRAERKRALTEIAKIRLEMRGIATAEEWNKVFAEIDRLRKETMANTAEVKEG